MNSAYLVELWLHAWNSTYEFFSLSPGQILLFAVTASLSLRNVNWRAPWRDALKHAPKHLVTNGLIVGATIFLYFLIVAPYQIRAEALIAEGQTLREENQELLRQTATTAEPENSLRKRVRILADAIDTFRAERVYSHPPYANNADENPSAEQRRINEVSAIYDIATERMCLEKFEDDIVGIPRELRGKGLDVKWLDQSQPRCFTEEEIQILRNLSFRLDGEGNRVNF